VTGHPVPPSEATIRRTVHDIDAEKADTIAGTWLHTKLQAEVVSPTPWRGLALDGKTLKGAWEEIDTGAGKGPVVLRAHPRPRRRDRSTENP
jgi:hypothetical protein